MAYSLTINGYEFDNPPEGYRKHITLGNTPVPLYEKGLAQFYQSDQQELQFEVEGRLSLNERSDLAELEELQQIAIEGGEVEVEFDPFFSGTCIIEDDPFRQENELGRYRFIMTVNSVETDTSAYPTHATPQTGNTFKLGSFDFGYDPQSVEENYERQTNTVDRLQGISRSADTAGLVTNVTIEGNTDGAGQAALWDKARQNELSYLDAEFQKGWALIDDFSVQNNQNAPDYLKGLFQYSLDLMIVSDPEGGIGEVSSYIDHKVKESGTYVSDADSGSYEKDAGSLSFTISNGTGSLNGDYVAWDTTTLTLTDNATNSVYISDDDGDGSGTVASGTSGYPANTVHLFTVVTSGGEITEIDDDRSILVVQNNAEPGELLKTSGLYAKLNRGSGDTTAGTSVAWVTTELLLTANATNYVFVDSTGDMDVNTTGYPSDSVHLYRLETDADSVTAVTDDRPSGLSGSSDTSNSDLVFSDDFVIDDTAFEFARMVTLSDSFDLSDPTLPWLGLTSLQDSIADVDDSDLLPALGKRTETLSFDLKDGGSASSSGTQKAATEWGTKSDWDKAASENRVVHENIGDYSAGAVNLGYPSALNKLVRYYTFHEDSGTTVYDYGPNGHHGNIVNSPTLGVDGLGIGTAQRTAGGSGSGLWEFPDAADVDFSTDFSVVWWNTFTSDPADYSRVVAKDYKTSWAITTSPNNEMRFEADGTVGYVNSSVPYVTDGSWNMYGFTLTSNDLIFYRNGTGDKSTHTGGSVNTDNVKIRAHGDGGGGSSGWSGDFGAFLVFSPALTDSEFQNLYDYFATGGSLTTATKSFTEAVKPDLENMDYSLNNQSITLDVVGSPGTADEERVTVSLTGANSADLSWTNKHTDFRLVIDLSTTAVTDAPEFRAADLTATVSGGGDADQNPKTHWTLSSGLFDTSGNEFEGGGITTKFGG